MCACLDGSVKLVAELVDFHEIEEIGSAHDALVGVSLWLLVADMQLSEHDDLVLVVALGIPLAEGERAQTRAQRHVLIEKALQGLVLARRVDELVRVGLGKHVEADGSQYALQLVHRVPLVGKGLDRLGQLVVGSCRLVRLPDSHGRLLLVLLQVLDDRLLFGELGTVRRSGHRRRLGNHRHLFDGHVDATLVELDLDVYLEVGRLHREHARVECGTRHHAPRLQRHVHVTVLEQTVGRHVVGLEVDVACLHVVLVVEYFVRAPVALRLVPAGKHRLLRHIDAQRYPVFFYAFVTLH